MLTVGVDMSAEDPRTWRATLDWSAGKATVVALQGAVSNAAIVQQTIVIDKIGIDCPFGWWAISPA